jgi:hypothetical protein
VVEKLDEARFLDLLNERTPASLIMYWWMARFVIEKEKANWARLS